MPRWEAIGSDQVDSPGSGHKDVVQAWLITLRESRTGTEHTGRVEVMGSAPGQRPDLCARVVATNGISAFDPFLDHQQPPLLVYITNEGVTVPRDGIYEAPAGSG